MYCLFLFVGGNDQTQIICMALFDCVVEIIKKPLVLCVCFNSCVCCFKNKFLIDKLVSRHASSEFIIRKFDC